MSGLTIPKLCGAILLPQTVLFPHGALPLHIFEPRYRTMLDHSLSGKRLICVGHLIADEKEPLTKCVAHIGTIALVRAARLLENGNYTLLLHGILRVRFTDWHSSEIYPLAEIQPALDTTLEADEEEKAKKTMQNALRHALAPFPKEVMAQFQEILEQAGNAACISDALAQQLIHDPEKRQQLLGITDTKKRVAYLIRFLKNTSDLI